jgi:hypothetical protein
MNASSYYHSSNNQTSIVIHNNRTTTRGVIGCHSHDDPDGNALRLIGCFIGSIPNILLFVFVFLIVVGGCWFVDCLRCCECEMVLVIDGIIYRIKKCVYRIVFCGYEEVVMDTYDSCMDTLDCFQLFCFCVEEEDDEEDNEEGSSLEDD